MRINANSRESLSFAGDVVSREFTVLQEFFSLNFKRLTFGLDHLVRKE